MTILLPDLSSNSNFSVAFAACFKRRCWVNFSQILIDFPPDTLLGEFVLIGLLFSAALKLAVLPNASARFSRALPIVTFLLVEAVATLEFTSSPE